MNGDTVAGVMMGFLMSALILITVLALTPRTKEVKLEYFMKGVAAQETCFPMATNEYLNCLTVVFNNETKEGVNKL